MTPRHAHIALPLAEALERICAPAVPTPAIPATLRRDLMAFEPEWHSGWLEYPDPREWEHSARARSILGRAEDVLEDVSAALFNDRWALGATLDDHAENGCGIVEAASALGNGDRWTAAWIERARAYARCGQ